MSDEIVQTKTFEERMRDRIKEDIGDLITDEELSAMVKKCVNDIFFEGRTVPNGVYNTKEVPSFFEAEVKRLMEPLVKKEVRRCVINNKELITKATKEVFEQGVGTLFVKALNDMFQNDLMSLQQNIQTSMQSWN